MTLSVSWKKTLKSNVQDFRQTFTSSIRYKKEIDWSKVKTFADYKKKKKMPLQKKREKIAGKDRKPFWGKEKILATTIFSFCHVFKSLLSHCH